jgi:hypothetical protein
LQCGPVIQVFGAADAFFLEPRLDSDPMRIGIRFDCGLLPRKAITVNLVSGSTAPDINDFISGASWQDKLADQDGRNFAIAGGPFEGTLNTTGVAQNRTFQGFIVETIPSAFGLAPLGTMYTVNMSH